MKQKKLIRPEYFQLLNDQVDEFKSMQALSAVLLADLKKAEGNEGGANELIEQVLSWVDAEKRMLPSTFPLNKPAVVKKIESNEGVYQYTGKRLWLFSMKTFNSIGEFQTYRENGSGRIISADNLTTLYPYTASQGDVISLIDDSGNRGADFREVLQSVGWSKAQAEALKMIAWTNGVSRNVSGGNFIDWSGNDGQGPFRVYHDPHAQFWKVASDKGLKGLVPVMTYQPLQ
jgi:hypothetical protein